MGLPANSRCPQCDTKVDAQLESSGDQVVKATSEEVVLEFECKEPECSRVWRAIYAFAGNE